MIPAFVYWIIICVLVVIAIYMYQIIRSKDKTIQSKNDTIELHDRISRSCQEHENARIKDDLTALHNALVKKYGKDYLYAISGAPEGDFFGKDRLPHSAASMMGVDTDRYTFYLDGSAPGSEVKYHARDCTFANHSRPINAYDLNKKNYRLIRACTHCSCKLPDTLWVWKYLRYYEFLATYTHENTLPDSSIILKQPDIKINYRGRT